MIDSVSAPGPRLIGHVDGIRGRVAYGWAWYPDHPAARVHVTLCDYDDDAGLVVPWRLFGSSGLEATGEEPVKRHFVRRAIDKHPLNSVVKTIVRSSSVIAPGIHTHRPNSKDVLLMRSIAWSVAWGIQRVTLWALLRV